MFQYLKKSLDIIDNLKSPFFYLNNKPKSDFKTMIVTTFDYEYECLQDHFCLCIILSYDRMITYTHHVDILI